ncbi:hypothetical protein [Paenibacillus polymyxa]|nr:hypothetical protein [Paenibacillus polymyxa]WOZ40713.1 hypothetical protein RQP19_12035 [Paenibacillus polymyxa]
MNESNRMNVGIFKDSIEMAEQSSSELPNILFLKECEEEFSLQCN